jgi:hypothetical protein
MVDPNRPDPDSVGGTPQDFNPYAAPTVPEKFRDTFSASRRARDPSITAEPWFNQSDFVSDSPEHAVSNDSLAIQTSGRPSLANHELAEHSVWDEPSTSASLSGSPDSQAVNWYRYYLEQAAGTSPGWTWSITASIAILAGPAAILGSLLHGLNANGLAMLLFFRPTIEELLKIAFPLWIVEKRPWLIASEWQILLGALAGGCTFAIIETAFDLLTHLPNPNIGPNTGPLGWAAQPTPWPGTTNVLMHATCSTMAAWGLVQVRRGMLRRRNQPQLADGGPWIAAAVGLHVLFNLLAIVIG